MAGNIIGEPIKPIIGEQVRLRQLIHGSGYNENSISRSPEVLNFLNNMKIIALHGKFFLYKSSKKVQL